jgi:hypothetical protein
VEEVLDVQYSLRLIPDTHGRALVLHDLCRLTMDQVANDRRSELSIGPVLPHTSDDAWCCPVGNPC